LFSLGSGPVRRGNKATNASEKLKASDILGSIDLSPSTNLRSARGLPIRSAPLSGNPNSFAFLNESDLNAYAKNLAKVETESEYEADALSAAEGSAESGADGVSESELEAPSDFTPSRAGFSGAQTRKSRLRRSLRTVPKSLRVPTMEELEAADPLPESSSAGLVSASSGLKTSETESSAAERPSVVKASRRKFRNDRDPSTDSGWVASDDEDAGPVPRGRKRAASGGSGFFGILAETLSIPYM
jgi:hypothetical protein